MKAWETAIEKQSLDRSCDRELGEELGWLVSPILNGFYYGYHATGKAVWFERLVDWTNACLKRATVDPDGYRGWPKGDGGGGASDTYDADSLLGEAMLLRPVVLFAATVQENPKLQPQFSKIARDYLTFAEALFEKWEARKVWREVSKGGIWVVPAFGIDRKTRAWSDGYATRAATGFSNPNNKANHIARWHLALALATGKPIYRQRADAWFRLMKSRLQPGSKPAFLVWNYWEPAGPWDYKPDKSPRHWVGVHPNGGYYSIDADAMTDAYEQGLVFDRSDLQRLIATNRDFMWNQDTAAARFRRIDGGETDPRWKNSPGVLWAALVRHDDTLRSLFIESHKPDGWGGLGSTPWFLSGAP